MDRDTLNKQAQKILCHRIDDWCKCKLNAQFSHLTCQLFDDKVVLVLENSIPQPVQLLVRQGKKKLIEQVRLNIESAIEEQLKGLIEEILCVEIVDLLVHTNIETSRTGIIAIFANKQAC